MLECFLLLLACQAAGELVRALTGLPLSGAVIGMVLLFVGLVITRNVPAGLQQVTSTILQHLSLLFVPAAVGVMLHLSLLREEWFAITAALIGSTVLTVILTGAVMRLLCRRQELLAQMPAALGVDLPTSSNGHSLRREVAR